MRGVGSKVLRSIGRVSGRFFLWKVKKSMCMKIGKKNKEWRIYMENEC